MKCKVPRSIAGREFDKCRLAGREDAARGVELPDVNAVEPEIDVKDKSTGGIGLDHVRVRLIMPTDCEAARLGIRGFLRANGAVVFFQIGRFPESPIRQDWQDRDGAPKVVGDEHELSRRVYAEVRGAFAAGAYRIEQAKRSVSLHRECAHTPGFFGADALGFVAGVKVRLRCVKREGTRTRAHFHHTARRHRAGGAVDFEKVNAASVSRRKIDLRGTHVLQRRSVGAHVGNEPRLFCSAKCARGKSGGTLEKSAAGNRYRCHAERMRFTRRR